MRALNNDFISNSACSPNTLNNKLNNQLNIRLNIQPSLMSKYPRYQTSYLTLVYTLNIRLSDRVSSTSEYPKYLTQHPKYLLHSI